MANIEIHVSEAITEVSSYMKDVSIDIARLLFTYEWSRIGSFTCQNKEGLTSYRAVRSARIDPESLPLKYPA